MGDVSYITNIMLCIYSMIDPDQLNALCSRQLYSPPIIFATTAMQLSHSVFWMD